MSVVGLVAKRVRRVVAFVVLALLVGAPAAMAGTTGWLVHSVPEPSQFSAEDPGAGCESRKEFGPLCDRFQLVVVNVGSEPSSGPVTLTDTLPAGIVATQAISGEGTGSVGVGGGEGSWGCSIAEGGGSVTCTYAGEPIPAGAAAPWLYVMVLPPSGGVLGPLRNVVSVEGGGAGAPVTVSQDTPVGSAAASFGVNEFTLEPDAPSGAGAVQAGGHPWTVTSAIGLTTHRAVPEAPGAYVPAENMKNVVTELPLGSLGNPQAAAKCTVAPTFFGACPQDTIVGSIGLGYGESEQGEFRFSGSGQTPVYNMVPSGGYPAEFAFGATGAVPVYLYANVVHGPGGYRLRVTSTGIPATLLVRGVFITFFGVPGQVNGTGSTTALLSNPTDCSAGPLSSHLGVEAWESPGEVFSREAVAYQQITGCDQLHFEPSLTVLPSGGGEGTTQTDEPSGFTADLKVPQSTDSSELATPPLKTATVTLPAGVSVSPSAADGLAGCQETGPDGINIGSSSVGPAGEDLGDPEASEPGEGHGGPGGNGSPYDDGLYHVAAGHCPSASQIGTVEVFTPILPAGPGGSAPIQGNVYLAAPKCGGSGQPVCTTASASNGELFGVYLEAHGDGVILKIPGTVAADPSTGQLTATFKDNPQQPFSDLKLHLDGGPRAPLANPQTCGQASTSALLEPWSAPETPSVTSTSSFGVDWDGQGGACPASMPFAPGFSAGTVNPAAGAFSPFTLSFSRHDREQDLSGLTVSTPPGLLGKLSSVSLCGEPQAAQGTCPAGSRIGSVSAAAGAGPHPYWVSGEVFLTGPYKGQPFGLSVVLPAKAGPFDLGNVVVRAAIHVDPTTAALTISSDPLPQIVDGVPLRVQAVNVTVDREGFVFNPTSCAQQQVSGTITAAQGASVGVSSPFTASGCKALPFKPFFSVSTQARTSKKQGASLLVKGSFPAGEANVHSVAVTLPKQLPARLTTIQQACTAAVFNANPASCPVGSNIGTATGITPVLTQPVTGPVYLVSHGGAAFPDVVAVLQGEGVTVDLTGSINIKHNITSSTFATIPDVPISSFTLTLPEGPHSGLAAVVPAKAKGSLCAQKLTMPFTSTAQNGAQTLQKVKIAVTGCPKAKKAKKHHKPHRHTKAKKKK